MIFGGHWSKADLHLERRIRGLERRTDELEDALGMLGVVRDGDSWRPAKGKLAARVGSAVAHGEPSGEESTVNLLRRMLADHDCHDGCLDPDAWLAAKRVVDAADKL